MKEERRTWAVLALPYAWLALFFLVPFAIVLKVSLAEQAMGIPPYTPLLETDEGGTRLHASLANYLFLLSDSLYFRAYLNAIKFAGFSTLLCLLLGYPMAYGIVRAPRAWRGFLLLMVILPFWTSFLIRVYAWIGLLKGNGLINNLLLSLGLVHEPLTLLNNAFAIYLGITYSYLPFMVLPLYAALEKLDESLLEAAADLGCPRWKVFWLVTVPLSSSGMLAGVLLCFIPIVGEFVIPDLLGGSQSPMIGQTIWMEFFGNKDWPAASAVAVVLVCLLVTPIVIYQNQAMRVVERD
jgi:putrescine transport system permease protein